MKKEDTQKDADLMDKIVSLCKRRGFVFPGSEIYGGLANSWDYGPLGVELKNNIKQSWWNFFVHQRLDMYGLDAAIIMNSKVWEASGHVSNFSDPLVECKNCHQRFRADEVGFDVPTTPYAWGDVSQPRNCKNCEKKDWSVPASFNLMFKTFLGPVEDSAGATYLRPETAQGMFVNFKHVMDSMSPALPFGMAQIGKAFRNEITPGNFIFRTREFEQMEIEYFIKPTDDWNTYFEQWLSNMKEWMATVGIAIDHVHDLEVPETERAHYSKRTVDLEFDFPFGRKELFGIAYRGDFDLANHQRATGYALTYFDEETKERYLPHVIEPTFGVERGLLAVLVSSYREETVGDDTRAYLSLPASIAPYKAAVFPLMANKPDLVAKAQDIYATLSGARLGAIAFDGGGNVGKRYRKQDEIGTPYCFTVDYQTLEDDTVTVRDRDTMTQERIAVDDLIAFLKEKCL